MMSAQLLNEALSPQQRYQREIDALLGQVDRLDAEAARRTIALLTEARQRIIATLAEVPADSYLASYLPRLQREVERIMLDYQVRYASYLNDQATIYWQHGVQFVDAPLTAAGATRVMSFLPSLEPRYVDILQADRSSLISGISDQATAQITRELRLGTLSGAQPFDIMRKVRDILDTQPDPAGVYHGVTARAGVITRTELNRVSGLATIDRQAMLAQRTKQTFDFVPKKQWLNAGDERVRDSHRSPDLLAQRPLMSADFRVRGYPAKGPHDPRLPASEKIN